MKNILKQLGEWAISLKDSQFTRARFTLTLYYSVGILIILCIFTFAVYIFFIRTFPYTDDGGLTGHALEERQSRREIENDIAEEAAENLLQIILILDGILLIGIIVISYELAKKTLEPIERSYENQKKFLADVAHELRTPLTVMKTGLETALHITQEKKEYERYIRDSVKEIDEMSTMVNDLLFLARSEIITSTEKKVVDISDIGKKVIEDMKPYAQTHHVTITENLTQHSFVKGKEAELKRMIRNLIKNAIDYNDIHGTVSVIIQETTDTIVFIIEDTGRGIAENNLPFIFERFYKIDSSRYHGIEEGSGLGLPIVKEIVKNHGGNITVTSTLGKGTTIRIELPHI